MEKVIRDGKVAVLISPGYGAGWYSWNTEHKELIFSPKLVEMVEYGMREDIDDKWVLDNLGIDIYTGGAYTLEINWIPEGTPFVIEEYDGAECIKIVSDLTITA